MSTPYEATGKIQKIGETQTFASGFQKREIIVETELDSKYPQMVKFEAVKERCDQLDNFQVGQSVTVAFNLRGNEYNGKFYVNLQAWKITSGEETSQAQPARPVQKSMPPVPNPTADALDEETDDIPF